jgi:hypothetical protein
MMWQPPAQPFCDLLKNAVAMRRNWSAAIVSTGSMSYPRGLVFAPLTGDLPEP